MFYTFDFFQTKLYDELQYLESIKTYCSCFKEVEAMEAGGARKGRVGAGLGKPPHYFLSTQGELSGSSENAEKLSIGSVPPLYGCGD